MAYMVFTSVLCCTAGERGSSLGNQVFYQSFRQSSNACISSSDRLQLQQITIQWSTNAHVYNTHTHIHGLHGLLVMTMRPRGITYINWQWGFFLVLLSKQPKVTWHEDKFLGAISREKGLTLPRPTKLLAKPLRFCNNSWICRSTVEAWDWEA